MKKKMWMMWLVVAILFGTKAYFDYSDGNSKGLIIYGILAAIYAILGVVNFAYYNGGGE
ncbi:MAG: hypothetical protein N4A40_05665 [Tissierellales bacterium]|jgi:hypothetical protein|nr:hypothetical protein [Tissierellales bacterium]